MGERQTVFINGREYDKDSGLPVGVAHLTRQSLRSENAAPVRKTARRVSTTSANIHNPLKTSTRIDSRFAKKPLAKRKLAYERYGAQAEIALESALARKMATQQADKATAIVNEAATAPLKDVELAPAQAIPTPAAVSTQTQEQPAIKPQESKAYIPAPSPMPSKPVPTQHATPPAAGLSNPKLESILKKNRKLARVDGFGARPVNQAAARQVKPQAQRHSLNPVENRATQLGTSSPDFNIPRQAAPTRTFNTESVMPHPIAERAQNTQRQLNITRSKQANAAPTSSSSLKDAIVKDTLDKAPKSNYKKLKSRPSKRRARILSFASGFAALALFAGYVTYLNVPNISVRVAAAQAGIDASYPGYQPNGFRLSGPVAYSDGEVQMNFVSRQDGTSYTLKESRSSWNSATLLENYVREASENDYTISKEKGITVYHFGNDAAWVSGGILYVIDGETQLTPEEIRNIATSV